MAADEKKEAPEHIRSPAKQCDTPVQAPIRAPTFSESLAEGAGIDFAYKKKRYDLHREGDRWCVRRFNTRYDYDFNKFEIISGTFSDPFTMIRTVTIEGITIEDIFRFHPEDRIGFDRKYNYEILLRDLSAGAEVEFSYKGTPYAILNWATGWEFSTNHKLTVVHRDVRELVKMIRIEGMTLQELFDNHYKKDNTGDLVLDALSHSISHEE